MFWLSVAFAIGFSAVALGNITSGLSSPLIAVIFAGNAYARLRRGTLTPDRLKTWVTWTALATSLGALVITIYKVAYGPAV